MKFLSAVRHRAALGNFTYIQYKPQYNILIHFCYDAMELSQCLQRAHKVPYDMFVVKINHVN
jgi:hypothetical protein